MCWRARGDSRWWCRHRRYSGASQRRQAAIGVDGRVILSRVVSAAFEHIGLDDVGNVTHVGGPGPPRLYSLPQRLGRRCHCSVCSVNRCRGQGRCRPAYRCHMRTGNRSRPGRFPCQRNGARKPETGTSGSGGIGECPGPRAVGVEVSVDTPLPATAQLGKIRGRVERGQSPRPTR